jgi:hypothetical protein
VGEPDTRTLSRQYYLDQKTESVRFCTGSKLRLSFYPNATCGEEELQGREGLTQSDHGVQNETGTEPALSDHCGEITFLLNRKEHRYRKLPTVHKSAHPSITTQGDHGKNPGYAVRQAVSVRTMRFAILPLVIHRKSQFVPAGNDVLIQVAPFRCTFFVPNDAVPSLPTGILFLVLRLALFYVDRDRRPFSIDCSSLFVFAGGGAGDSPVGAPS